MSALQVYDTSAEVKMLSTGSHRLDHLFGGIETNQFYLFFSDTKEKITDTILFKLMVETLKDTSGQVLSVLCGNYRRDRRTFDSEEFLDLLEESGLDLEESLRRVQIICVFSESQLMNLPSFVSDLI